MVALFWGPIWFNVMGMGFHLLSIGFVGSIFVSTWFLIEFSGVLGGFDSEVC